MPADDSFISLRTLLLPSAVLTVGYVITRIVSRNQRHARATQVRGPPRTSVLWGCWSEVSELNDSLSFYEKWNNEYGPAVDVPMPLGIKRIMLLDPKAIASFYAKDTYEYVNPGISKAVIERMVSVISASAIDLTDAVRIDRTGKPYMAQRGRDCSDGVLGITVGRRRQSQKASTNQLHLPNYSHATKGNVRP